MTIDRWGKTVLIGWADHEMEWVRAALTLPQRQRLDAFADIASMTGRTFCAVADRAGIVKARQRADAAALERSKRIMTPKRSRKIGPVALPSQLNPPTRARLMGAR